MEPRDHFSLAASVHIPRSYTKHRKASTFKKCSLSCTRTHACNRKCTSTAYTACVEKIYRTTLPHYHMCQQTKLAKLAIKVFSKVWTRILFYPWTRTEKQWISQQVFSGSQSPLDNIKKPCKISKSWIRYTTKIIGVDQSFMSNLSFEIVLFTLVKRFEFCPHWRDSSRTWIGSI